jgi:excisionase family DNA binding protein
MISEPKPRQTSKQPPLAVRIPIAAEMLGLSRSTIYELLEAGDLRSIKVGRVRLVIVASLTEFIESRVLNEG